MSCLITWRRVNCFCFSFANFISIFFSCCNWGEGSYELSFDGNVVASGGEFGFDETKTFTTPSSGGGSKPNPLPSPPSNTPPASTGGGSTPPASTGGGSTPNNNNPGGSTPNNNNPPPPASPPAPQPEPATATVDCYDVLIELFFDTYPQDTSWDVSQGDNIVASSPPYADNLAEDTETLCLSPGNYVFTVYDVYQDGMCCQWGEGSYRVTSNQKIIKEGGEFGVSESTEFSLPTTA